MSDGEVLICAEHVSKKFCRSLKRSLWYGAQDVANSLLPWKRNENSDGVAGEDVFREPALRKDEFWAVRDVSFEVRRGECLGLIGHNGAGKSTLLKMLNSLIRPDSGQITLKGRVGALIELSAGFNPILTGRENIYNQAALLGFSRKETDAKFDAIVDFSELEDFLDMPVQNYSSGMRVRLGFAVAAQMEPDILLIDEVLAVGDVGFRFKCLNAIGRLMQSTAVIFVSHTMPQVFRICSQVMVLENSVSKYLGRDISRGVQIYTAIFNGQDQVIVGSGEAAITGLTVSSDSCRAEMGEKLMLAYGEPLQFRARVRSTPGLRDVRIEFLLWSAEMLPVMEFMTDSLVGYLFDFPETGELEVVANCGRMELNTGLYVLTVIITTKDHTHVLCRHDNIASIQVTADSPSGAQVVRAANWASTPVAANSGAGSQVGAEVL